MSSIPRNTSSTDPKLLKARVFIGNLPTEKVKREDLTETFEKYGEVIGCSLLRGYGFVQFLNEDDARNAVNGENGKTMHGAVMDVRMAAEGKRSAPEKQEEVPPPREKPRRRSRSPHRSKWDYPTAAPPHHPPYPHDYYSSGTYPPENYPPSELYPPPQPYHDSYDYYFHDNPPPGHHVRHHSPPPPAHRPPYPAGDWEHESRPPPPGAGWEQDEHMRQRRRHSPRPPSPRPQWYRQSPPAHSDWHHRPPSPRQQGHPRSPRQQVPPRPESKVDMEIIVINKQQMDYANMVSRRVQDLGLKVATKTLAPTASLSQLLDDIAKKGLLYAVIITSQHEVHGSLTLTILYGRNPQEHKNMPLEDALGLINRDFSRYCQAVREGHMRQQSNRPPDVASAGGSSDLTIEQITSVIDNLQHKKNELIKKQVGALGIGGGGSIQQQQADLQAKILSLLGSNAVVPPSTRPPAPQSSRDYWGPY